VALEQHLPREEGSVQRTIGELGHRWGFKGALETLPQTLERNPQSEVRGDGEQEKCVLGEIVELIARPAANEVQLEHGVLRRAEVRT
jgi:hypothetical protein